MRETRRVEGRGWTLGQPVPSLIPADDGHWGCPLSGGKGVAWVAPWDYHSRPQAWRMKERWLYGFHIL